MQETRVVTRRHDITPAGEEFADRCCPVLPLGERSSSWRTTELRLPGYLLLCPFTQSDGQIEYPAASPLRPLNLRALHRV